MWTRRRFLGAAVGGALAATHARSFALGGAAAASAPFLHGVASGDPLRDRVIIWTRVTPSASAVPGSGVGPPVDVAWEVATDPGFEKIVKQGSLTTTAVDDHTVHVDVTGLDAGRDHWYRFRALGATSPSGRTRTAPDPGASLDALRLAVLSCAYYEFGYFGAYRHLAARDDIDAVVHLGDYIYEFGLTYGSPPEATPTPGDSIGRTHEPPHECVSLADYRARYGQYHGDPDLMALHAAHPVIAMWDDHEVANDTWSDGAENHGPEQGDFAVRAAAARKAWREWMPARRVDPSDPARSYRSIRFGDLVELWMLDERRYRSEHADNAFISYGSADPAIDDPSRTMLGAEQHDWLVDGVTTNDAAWTVLGNPVPFFPFVMGPALASVLDDTLGPPLSPVVPLPAPLTVDDWNGYRAEQRALIDLFATGDAGDVVVLTGDYHESFVADVPVRPGDYALDANSVAVEFVVPAVTTPGLGELLEAAGVPDGSAAEAAFEANLVANNPWVRFHEGRAAGFGVIEFTAERAHYDFWFLDDKLDEATGAQVASSWEVRRGVPNAVEASGPLGDRARVNPQDAVAPDSDVDAGGEGTLPATGAGVSTAAAGLAAAAGAAAWAFSRRVATTTPEV